MATIIASLTRAYAKAIYLDGTRKFSEILPDYVEPVKQYAAATYTEAQIKNAYERGWITEQEQEETLSFKTP